MTYNVDNETHVVEVLVDVAATPAKDSIRQAPTLGFRGSRLDISRNLASREVPYLDVFLIPQHGINASILCVEGVAIGSVSRTGRVKAAADVEVADVAICIPLEARIQSREGGILNTALGGMC